MPSHLSADQKAALQPVMTVIRDWDRSRMPVDVQAEDNAPMIALCRGQALDLLYAFDAEVP